MRSLYLFTIVLFASISLSSCNNDKEPNPEKELPTIAWEFIKEYFPGNELVDFKKYDGNIEDNTYYVVLSNNTAIFFNREGYWNSVHSSLGLPINFLQSINDVAQKIDVINELYPDDEIVIVRSTMWGKELQLSNSSDRLFIFYGIDNYLVGNIIKIQDYPAESASLVNNCFTGSNKTLLYTIKVLEEDKIAYHNIFENSSYIHFDKYFDWFEIQSYDNGINKEILKNIPNNIYKYWDANYSNHYLYAIEIIKGNYIFKIENREKIIIHENGLISPDKDKAYDFVMEHFEFGNDKNPKIEVTTYKENIYFDFLYYLNNGNLNLRTDIESNWIQVQNIVHNGNKPSYFVPLPESLLKTLPESINKYLNEYYKDSNVTFLKRENGEYVTGLNDKVLLKFNEDGEFIEIVE